jgi:hypothetical protein
METLKQIPFQDILKMSGKKKIYNAIAVMKEPSKNCFNKSLEYFGQGKLAIKKASGYAIFFALFNKGVFIESTIEKVFSEECIDYTLLKYFEQDKIYRLTGGDPWDFIAKIKGRTIIKGRPFLVLQDQLGNLMFFRIFHEKSEQIDFLEIHEDQENLPVF